MARAPRTTEKPLVALVAGLRAGARSVEVASHVAAFGRRASGPG
jgi:hypothetical protein